LAFDGNSVVLEPIVLEPHMDFVVEEVDVRTLAYKMARPYIVVVEVDYHTEVYVGSYVDCTHIEAWPVVDYTHKSHTDFGLNNSHKDLPFPWAPSRNRRCVLCVDQLELVPARSELGVPVSKRLLV
jgi:hypothetical protein